ncbi:MAG: DUF2911 domain-containing protein [Flavobacteriaceae bacterium]
MKKFTILICAVLLSFSAYSQLEVPQPSPDSKLKQTVGLTEVTVKYSRPSMRGRTIMGDLVPFDKIWRTGANARTAISFSDDIVFGGTEVKAGTYAIFTKPGASSWEVYLHDIENGFGTPQEMEESKVAAKATAEAHSMEMPVETFTINIDRLHNNGATLGFIWENTYVGVPFEVPTKAKADKSIEAVFGGPTGNDYFAAANYYYSEKRDLEKAKKWIDKAVASNDKAFWMMRQQSLIYAELGDKAEAIKAAKKSLEVAQAAGNADYVKMNKDSLKEWGAL